MGEYKLFKMLVPLSNFEPYSDSEGPVLLGMTIVNFYGDEFEIMDLFDGGVVVEIDENGFMNPIYYDELLYNYRFKSGKVCGKKINKDYGKKED